MGIIKITAAPKAAVTTKLDKLVFLLGADPPGTGNPYFTLALAYWTKQSATHHLVTGKTSLEDVHDFMLGAPPAGVDATFSEVNIVAHGNELQWLTKLKRADTVRFHDHPQILDRVGEFKVSAVAAKFKAGAKLIFRGCNIGKNADLCDALRDLFGTKATLYAPKHVQVYESDTEYLDETFIQHIASDTMPSDTALLALYKKAGPASIPDAEWTAMLARKHHSGEAYNPPFSLATDYFTESGTYADGPETGKSFAPDDEPDEAENKTDYAAKRLGPAYSAWKWVETITKSTAATREASDKKLHKLVKPVGTATKTFTAHMQRVVLLRVAPNSGVTTKLLVPDLTNSDHYYTK